MHLVCKFSLGSKLTKKELQYVLTPDECIGQLSRMRNIPDVLSQLPKTFSDQLPLSAKKDIHSLLAAIKQELIKANWVATSLLTRHVSISEAQLKAYPKFGLLVSSLSLTDIDKVHKAGYQAVTDDVPLARNLTYTPVTPSPDQKIVVEFAGQWPSNAACLMLGKTDAQKEKVTVSKVDHDNQHRSLATFKGLENEPKTLYIRIPCPGQPTPILLKLVEGLTPVDKDTDMDEWDNVLVPVRPLIYATEDLDKSKLADAVEGYVYIFWKKKLWRELTVSESGYFSDIDIEYYRQLAEDDPNRDERISSGFNIPHLWLPYKIGGEVQSGENGLGLMYCRRRLNWTAIEQLESDSDIYDTSVTVTDELETYSSQQAFDDQQHIVDIAIPELGIDAGELRSNLQSDSAAFQSQKFHKTAAIRLKNNSGGPGIVLRNQFDQRYANMPYLLEAGSDQYERTTDSKGFIPLGEFLEFETVLVGMQANEFDENYSDRMLVNIGTLKDIDDEEGIKQRLLNHDAADESVLNGDDTVKKMALTSLQYHCGLVVDACENEETLEWLKSHDTE